MKAKNNLHVRDDKVDGKTHALILLSLNFSSIFK
jgi:hypothetical protein